MLRNRIHTVVDRHPHLERPAVKDLFSKADKAWMKRASLPACDRTLLDEDLALHALVQTHIDALEAVIATDNGKNPIARRLQALPGWAGFSRRARSADRVQRGLPVTC